MCGAGALAGGVCAAAISITPLCCRAQTHHFRNRHFQVMFAGSQCSGHMAVTLLKQQMRYRDKMTVETPNSAVPVDADHEKTRSCWSCGAMRAAHFCGACGRVQPPVPVDYFA